MIAKKMLCFTLLFWEGSSPFSSLGLRGMGDGTKTSLCFAVHIVILYLCKKLTHFEDEELVSLSSTETMLLAFTKINTAPWGLDGFNLFCVIDK